MHCHVGYIYLLRSSSSVSCRLRQLSRAASQPCLVTRSSLPDICTGPRTATYANTKHELDCLLKCWFIRTPHKAIHEVAGTQLHDLTLRRRELVVSKCIEFPTRLYTLHSIISITDTFAITSSLLQLHYLIASSLLYVQNMFTLKCYLSNITTQLTPPIHQNMFTTLRLLI